MGAQEIHTVRLAQMPPQRWKNDGGSTRELLTWPTALDWVVRISVAQIEQNGPFSAYPGIQRWFAVLEGAGVSLHFAAASVELGAAAESFHFDGEQAPECELLGGATQDLNLMVRRDRARGQMRRVEAGAEWHSTATFRAVFAATDANLLINGIERIQLAEGSLIWSDAAAGARWCLTNAGSPLRAWWMEAQLVQLARDEAGPATLTR